MSWFETWFNEDYLKLYAYRDRAEAQTHVSFVQHQLKMRPESRILDLGCGAGRHALLFAELGFEVVGIDQSSTLIAEAEKAANKRSGLHLTLHVGDMRNLEGYGFFDYVFSFFTSFGYFETEDEDLEVLKQVTEALNPKGHFLLDFLHPEQVRHNLVAKETRQIDQSLVHIERRIENNVAIKTIDFPDRHYEEHVRLYDRTSIENMLKRTGLGVQEVWGDYAGSAWSQTSPRQIFHAQRI